MKNLSNKTVASRVVIRLILIGFALLAGLFFAEGILFVIKADAGVIGPGKKGRNTKRLVCLGDSLLVSIMKGMNEEDLIAERLEAKLPGWEVVNLAVSGEGPVFYRDVWEKHGRKCQPDAVLTFYYVGNDMKDVWGETRRLDFDLASVEAMLVSQRTEWRPSMSRRAARKLFPRLYQMLKRAAKPREVKTTTEEHDTLAQMALQHALATDRTVNTNTLACIPEEYLAKWQAGELNPWMLATAAVAPEYHRECVEPTMEEHIRAFNLGLELIKSINEDCMELTIPHYLVVIPSALQLIEEAGKHHQLIGYDTEGVFGNTNAQMRIAAFCSDTGMPYLDLTPVLLPVAAEAYYVIDGHWKPEGHRLTAEAVFGRLSADGVFP